MMKHKKIKYDYIDKKLELLGKIGNRWQKHGKDRIYFDVDDVLHWLGYKWTYYNTGNVCRAYYDGEKISNCSFNKTYASIEKVWYDVTENSYVFCLDVVSSYTPRSSIIINAIEEAAGIEEQESPSDAVNNNSNTNISLTM